MHYKNLITLLIAFWLAVGVSAQPTPNDDEYWAQRILSAANVVASQLDHQGKVATISIRRNHSLAELPTSWPFGTAFVFPDNLPATTRVRAARAQAAGIITSAWLRYTGDVNAACLDSNQPLRYPRVDGEQIYRQLVGP